MPRLEGRFFFKF